MKKSLVQSAALFLICHVAHILGQTSFDTSVFSAQFAAGSGVLESLTSKSAGGFDFSPSDYFQYRNGNGNYHTGDLGLRFRTGTSGSWTTVETAQNRQANTAVTQKNGVYQSNLNAALPAAKGVLDVSRVWAQVSGDLTLSFTITNVASSSVQIGALGMPIEFNNIFYNRTAVDTTNKCVLVDPYIGLHAGYVQVTRLTGTGPNLILTPLGNETKFEGWRFLSEPTNGALPYQSQVFEGNYEWDVFTQAFADNEWKNATPWNPPTSQTLARGQSLTVGLRFSIAPTVQQIESTVSSKAVPVAVGIPGYVLPTDIRGRLFINTERSIKSVTSDPAGVISVKNDANVKGWKAFTVTAPNGFFGRVRLVLTLDDNRTMAVHYHLAKAGSTAVGQLGDFLHSKQWYTDTSDPFHRAPSVISYDHEVGAVVLQDDRVWIAGISDEGGAGSFLAAGMKQAFSPNPSEIAKLEEMVNQTVWGHLQNAQYGVAKSLFFYEPDAVPGYKYRTDINWAGAWDKADALAVWRAYDYVHVSNLYWSLYQAGKNYPNVLTIHDRLWYLNQAYHTVLFVYGTDLSGNANTAYGDVGLMGETIWGNLLDSLIEEGLTTKANTMSNIMKSRQQTWAGQADPFGSEMAWDSTGQEGVYYWSQRFNDSATVQKVLNSIRGYMPTIPHWGYNGNARRYWDFLYGGKYPGIERQLHHYGSGLNSLPLLDAYHRTANPSSLDSIYDLRVGYGGNQGPLSNIHEDGFGSMAFHSYPQNLYWDPYTGDYGPNFVGHALGVATYLVNHPTFGWVSFGGNVVVKGNQISVQPKDTLRKRIYVAPLGVYVRLSAGTISSFTYMTDTNSLQVVITANDAASVPAVTKTTLYVESGALGTVVVKSGLQGTGGKYSVDFSTYQSQTITLARA
ncbi:hypothetical protein K461DRAFT_288427 [Myriangium duriaei CBS 260.36]|uniref:Uncharacterized protein n=1 Tax=Myriangium duriaei CBS 260.36 TaxID=1168546 RepID=A0A9P4ISA2_9PEZI|nr:hypothetical protein K461DRAFT_288427 [Myriangium duriaei CBS 260.36]